MENESTRVRRRKKAREASREKQRQQGVATFNVIWMWEKAKAVIQSLLDGC